MLDMKGTAMISPSKAISRLAPVLIILALITQPGELEAFEKKLRVSADYARIHLQADDESLIVETLERGHLLSLLYSGKMRKIWYYVCFKSVKTGQTKSGYVLDTAVELLFDPLKTITIAEESQSLRVNYAPRKFDEMKWGLSKKQILEMEGKPLSQEKAKGLDIMKYQQKLINLDCSIEYEFAANKLTGTRFSFDTEYLDKNAYLKDYQKVKNALVQKFGRPLEEAMDWRDTTFKDDFGAWGEAVSLGHLELSSLWMTPQTEIQAVLSGENEEIFLTVEYSGRQLRELVKKSEEE
ncbi:MAG: hypothetical protein WBC70_10690 [Candidatus Aminicenantales bacterium]